MATVDVIIPSYNSKKTIAHTLASIAMQQMDEGDSFKVTIVNDCSTDTLDYDNLIDYWSCLMDIDLVDKGVNEGCGQARQTGMDETDGDYICFVDADDCFITPYALRDLCRAMDGHDIVMGQFVEDTGHGIVPHGENFTWCHGKMYRRTFIETFRVRFNKTRGNEDVGFNTLLSKLTDRILYIPQTVYSWNNNKESLVRHDEAGYRFGYGWRDFMENIAWSCEEQERRKVNKSITRDFAIDVTARLYIQFSESLTAMPEEKEENTAKLKEYYDRAVRPFVMDGAVTYDHFKAAYFKIIEEKQQVVPKMTYKEFLRILGFFDDLKKLYDAEEV